MDWKGGGFNANPMPEGVGMVQAYLQLDPHAILLAAYLASKIVASLPTSKKCGCTNAGPDAIGWSCTPLRDTAPPDL